MVVIAGKSLLSTSQNSPVLVPIRTAGCKSCLSERILRWTELEINLRIHFCSEYKGLCICLDVTGVFQF